MTADEEWAAVTFRIIANTSDGLSRLPTSLIRQAATVSGDGVVTFELTVDDSVRLRDQWDAVGAFLNANRETLPRGGERYRLDVIVGWTPRPSQDGVTLAPALVQQLARFNAGMIFDLYPVEPVDEEDFDDQ